METDTSRILGTRFFFWLFFFTFKSNNFPCESALGENYCSVLTIRNILKDLLLFSLSFLYRLAPLRPTNSNVSCFICHMLPKSVILSVEHGGGRVMNYYATFRNRWNYEFCSLPGNPETEKSQGSSSSSYIQEHLGFRPEQLPEADQMVQL